MHCVIVWRENQRFAKRLGEDFPLTSIMMGAISIEKAPDVLRVEGFVLAEGVWG